MPIGRRCTYYISSSTQNPSQEFLVTLLKHSVHVDGSLPHECFAAVHFFKDKNHVDMGFRQWHDLVRAGNGMCCFNT